MSDYLEFTNYLSHIPPWAKTVVSIFLIGLAAKIALRPAKLLIFGGLCAAAMYALFNSA